jgi:hypothetical protein
LGTVAGVVALVYVPSVSTLAGAVYLFDQYLHWDHFAISAAWAYSNGMALGTEIYCQYGVGYPLLIGLAWNVVSPGYTAVIHAAILYVCVYFVTFYAVLRTLKVNSIIALAGTLAAIWASLFSPFHSEAVIQWAWPSQSILRAPFEVWMALALIAHLKSNRRIFLAAAGFLAGAAVLFEIDTGVPLLLALAVYCLANAFINRSTDRSGVIGDLAATTFAFVVVLALGLAVASRGTLITSPAEFFSGWLRGITGYAGSGAGSMVFLARNDPGQITIFVALVTICFVPVALALTHLIHGQATRSHIFGAACGIYGLERLTVYVARTLSDNLLHTSLPAIGILTVIIGVFYSTLLKPGDQSKQTSPAEIEKNTLRIAFPPAVLLVAAFYCGQAAPFTAIPGSQFSQIPFRPTASLSNTPKKQTIFSIPCKNSANSSTKIPGRSIAKG